MWCITREGFLSVVQDRSDKNLVRVRARTERHITQFADAVEADHADIIDMEQQSDDFDYRFVLNVPREVWAEYLVSTIDDLPMGHVKEHVSRIGTSNPDHDLYDFMLDVWTRGYRLQSGVKKKTGRRIAEMPLWDDDWSPRRDPDPTPAHGIPRVAINPFAEAAKAVAEHVDPDDPTVEFVNVIVIDDGTPRDIRLEVKAFDDVHDDEDEWYETVLIPAVRDAGWDPDTIDDWWIDGE